MSSRAGVACVLGAALAACGCDDPKPPAPAPTATEAPVTEAPKPAAPKGPPTLFVDDSGASIGGNRIDLSQPEGLPKLKATIDEKKSLLEGTVPTLGVDRKAKLTHVGALLDALASAGVKRALVRTTTRTDFPGELHFVPLAAASKPAPCSVIGMITEDRGSAVWKVTGGAAGKRGKGMAGPDLTLTGETVERLSKNCDSKTFFVSAAEGVEWGLAYDLAASTKSLPKTSFTDYVLIPEKAVPGHALDIAK
jgi:hypothetical protein